MENDRSVLIEFLDDLWNLTDSYEDQTSDSDEEERLNGNNRMQLFPFHKLGKKFFTYFPMKRSYTLFDKIIKLD
jgi:hypothetical protein